MSFFDALFGRESKALENSAENGSRFSTAQNYFEKHDYKNCLIWLEKATEKGMPQDEDILNIYYPLAIQWVTDKYVQESSKKNISRDDKITLEKYITYLKSIDEEPEKQFPIGAKFSARKENQTVTPEFYQQIRNTAKFELGKLITNDFFDEKDQEKRNSYLSEYNSAMNDFYKDEMDSAEAVGRELNALREGEYDDLPDNYF